MNHLSRAFVVFVWLLVVPAVSQGQTERALPAFDEKIAKSLLLVADLAPGEYFARPPKPAKCNQPNVVCLEMDPPPFSLIATVRSSVYGPAVQDKIELIVYSHYGMGEYEKGLNSVLIMIKADGQNFLMPRYAKKTLVRNKKNDLYLLIQNSDPIWWLPCSVSDLKEEISSAEFEPSIEISENDIKASGAEKFPEYFRRTASGVVPRYAIAISKLSAHLKQLDPVNATMSCP